MVVERRQSTVKHAEHSEVVLAGDDKGRQASTARGDGEEREATPRREQQADSRARVCL